jgi:hypothetical protein
MTKKSQEARDHLMRDIEAYTCGEDPSPLEMLRAARLENWEAAVRRRGKEFVLVVSGDVHQHPEIPDGENIQTSAVVWFDRNCRWMRTTNRLYALAERAGRR